MRSPRIRIECHARLTICTACARTHGPKRTPAMLCPEAGALWGNKAVFIIPQPQMVCRNSGTLLDGFEAGASKCSKSQSQSQKYCLRNTQPGTLISNSVQSPYLVTTFGHTVPIRSSAEHGSGPAEGSRQKHQIHMQNADAGC